MPKIQRIIAAEINVFIVSSIAVFPHYGKSFRVFSTLWKECFHGVEEFIVFFHTVENSFPQCGKVGAEAQAAI